MIEQLKAVVFYVDGTLDKTEINGHRIAFNHAFSVAGLNWFWDETSYGELLAVTGGKERIAYYLSAFHTGSKHDSDLALLIRTLYAAKAQFYVALLASKDIVLSLGIARLIKAIRQAGLRMAIATVTTPENVTALIHNTLGEVAVDWFDCITAGDIVSVKKPAPDIFNYCLAEMGLSAAECLVIEGSENGLKTALAAGGRRLSRLYSYTQGDDFAGAILVLDHLGDEALAGYKGLACQVLAGPPIKCNIVTVADLKAFHARP